jgi:hypothetical protein
MDCVRWDPIKFLSALMKLVSCGLSSVLIFKNFSRRTVQQDSTRDLCFPSLPKQMNHHDNLTQPRVAQ